jgi:hypothetical protein
MYGTRERFGQPKRDSKNRRTAYLILWYASTLKALIITWENFRVDTEEDAFL